MIRNFIGILFFILSGFITYGIGLIAFIEIPDVGSGKFIIMGFSSIFLIISHLLGLAFYKGANWKRVTGITLFWGEAFNILVVISMLSIKGTPEISEIMDTSSLNAFSDYLSGLIFMVLVMVLAAVLFIQGKSEGEQKTPLIDE